MHFACIHGKMAENYVNRIGETTVEEKKRIQLKKACIGLGILLLLLIAGDSQESRSNALLTLALYFIL